MTLNPHIELGGAGPADPQGTQPAPRRVRVYIAGVTVEIDLGDGPSAATAATLGTAPSAPSGGPAAPTAPSPASAVSPSAGAAGDGPGTEPASDRQDLHQVRAPMVGTFYHAPEPGSAPFVTVGDVVTEGQQIGIVEAMKLMNRIDADASGRVVEVLVPDATPVEYDQPLLAIESD